MVKIACERLLVLFIFVEAVALQWKMAQQDICWWSVRDHNLQTTTNQYPAKSSKLMGLMAMFPFPWLAIWSHYRITMISNSLSYRCHRFRLSGRKKETVQEAGKQKPKPYYKQKRWQFSLPGYTKINTVLFHTSIFTGHYDLQLLFRIHGSVHFVNFSFSICQKQESKKGWEEDSPWK